MRKAVGVLIVLWGVSKLFSNAAPALDSAAAETFKAIEAAAIVSQSNMLQNQ